MIVKVLIGIGVLVVVLALVVIFSVKSNQNESPPELAVNFVNLDKIEKISKYRSCVGHVTVPQDERESKRSMKHYFEAKSEFSKNQTVEIYAPFDGYVTTLRSDPGEGLEGEIWIVPKRKLPMLPPFGVWQFSVQHIDVRKDLKLGSEVKAGELIGYAAFSESRIPTFDIVYGKMAFPPAPKRIDNWNSPFSDLDSIFNHMSDNVLAQYKQKGLSKEGVVLSKEERDQNPCTYKDNGPYFQGDSPDNWVTLK